MGDTVNEGVGVGMGPGTWDVVDFEWEGEDLGDPGEGDIGDVSETWDVVDSEWDCADLGDPGEEIDGGKVGGVEEEEEVVEEMHLVEEEQEEEEGQYTLESLPEEILFKIFL